MKLLRLALATLLYVAILCGVWMVTVNFLRVDVVFYAAIWSAVAATLILAVLVWVTPLLRGFSGFEKFQQLMSCVLIGYIMAISVPTVIDRSLSFYILEKIQQRGGGILHDRFADVFTKEYMHEHRLVDVRLTEQLASGTIEIRNGCVKLTDKGQQLANASRYFRSNFLPKQRLLMGQYSSDLVNPFRNSASVVDYQCQ